MSEVTLGVLRMPEHMFFDDEPIHRMQVNSRRLDAADMIEELRERVAELRNQNEALHDLCGRFVDSYPDWLDEYEELMEQDK